MSPPLRILIIGAGGREHALAWKLSQSPLVEQIFVSPGNGGTASCLKCTNVPSGDFQSLLQVAQDRLVNLVVPGPEQPLVDGIEAIFRKVGIPVFGPTASAARMEGSKAFSKDFMAQHSIPTARYRTFQANELAEATEYVKTCGHKIVLKASGLAGGKGVLIPETQDEALAGLEDIMVLKVFGDAGSEVVIEEYLEGPELSILAFSDGYTIVPLPAAQDHKRIGENDTGPNTGGMGAYAPAPVATAEVMKKIVQESLEPTISGMRKDGYPFVGLLFTGFILTADGPKVLEYNVRFGDPETEALILLLDANTDLATILLACVDRRLDAVTIKTRPGVAVSVVLASQGYPGSYSKGKPITIETVESSDTVVFHAGTSIRDDKHLVSSGGRVLVVSSFGPTLQAALDSAYATVGRIQFEGKVFRRDIGHRALQASTSALPSGSLTYAQAGVSVSAGNALVEAIKPHAKSTRRPGADGSIGGFGGVFDLKAAGFDDDSLLVSGTDGVGTKLRVALEIGIHDTVGIDLVAMSVNDLVVQGAEPLYFLDYYGCAKLDVGVASEVIKGIAEGCRQSGCALIGGETAEMPGMYADGDYDLAGFAVGAVKRSLLLPRVDIHAGDVLLGLPSSGLHSNGFSLVRKILALSQLSYSSHCPWDPSSQSVGHSLLTPTKIYVKSLLPACHSGVLKALSHITGGGFIENIPRVLPKGLGCTVDAATWLLPDVFKFLMKAGNVEALEMARTFNCGVGMVIIVGKDEVDKAMQIIRDSGEQPIIIGTVTEGEGVTMVNLEKWQ